MENDIGKLKIQIETMERALARVIDVVDGLEAKSPSVKHIDLIDDVKPTEIEEEQSVDITLKELGKACEDVLDELAEKDAMRVESEMVSGDDPQPFKDEEKAAEEAAPKKSAKSSKNKK